MTAELGIFFLILALLCALLQALFLLPRFSAAVAPCLLPAAWLQTLFVACAFFTLMLLRLDSDFSVANVAAHSNLSLPLLYKIAGTWGNHEGSMLLWTLVLSGFGLALAYGRSEDTLKSVAIAVQSALAAGVLLFILFTSNPFTRLFPPPADGEALNPILQDIALAIHPPLLYLGYVGFSIVFSLSVAFLLLPPPLRGRVGVGGSYSKFPTEFYDNTPPPTPSLKGRGYIKYFAQITQPWILFSWSALTLGIGLGSWWAYRELGWGGFWFWDPVENASLLPWLAGTALLHSNIVLKNRGQLGTWVLLLSILTFGLSLVGTFLVRSGMLTSVHSFASDPERGLFILGYICVAVGGALLLFGMRVHKLEPAEPMHLVSREGMIVFNNLFFLCGCAVVLLGTLYPLVAEWLSGEKMTVGAPYFNATFIPLMALPVLLAGIAPLMPWKRGSMGKTLRNVRYAFLATLIIVYVVLVQTHTRTLLAMLGTGLGAWLFIASLQWFIMHWGKLARAYTLAIFLGHAGAAVLVLGITGTGVWQQETTRTMRLGDIAYIGGYQVTYRNHRSIETDNYQGHQGDFDISRQGKTIAVLEPEYRLYDIRRMATHEAAIHSEGGNDLYAVIGDLSADGKRAAVRLYWMPMIGFIWLGCIMMALGGVTGVIHARSKSVMV